MLNPNLSVIKFRLEQERRAECQGVKHRSNLVYKVCVGVVLRCNINIQISVHKIYWDSV